VSAGGAGGTVELSGGQVLARMLEAQGARWAFGMGGFQLLPFYDALTEAKDLRHALIKDERDGAFMADAYARVSGTPGVCDGTLGPGVTNLITGLAESLGAGVPVIAIAGEVNSGIAGRGATQESRQLAMVEPTVKEAIRVDRIERVPELVRHAYAVATAGRPGPVLLNVAENVTHGSFEFPLSDLWVEEQAGALPGRRTRGDADDVEAVAAMLASAERPLILAGGGIHLSGAYEELRELAERFELPVATTISGKGAIAESHPLALGVFGRYSRTGNDAIAAADALLVVGCKLGEIATNRWTLLPEGPRVAQIDVDAAAIGRNVRTEAGVWGDAKLALADLATALAEHPAADRASYLAELAAGKEAWLAEHHDRRSAGDRPIHQARMLKELNAAIPEDGVLVADGGFAAHWSALYWETPRAGRHYIANRGHASIGYGLPGALGAHLGSPAGTKVVGLVGDGGLGMSIGELETAVRLNADVVIVVVDNQASGYVKALQHALFEDRFQSVDCAPVDYSRVAQEFGVHGERVEYPDELAAAFARAFAVDGPALVDVAVTREAAGMLPAADPRTRNRPAAAAKS
jgi:acetolactate synthase I/II/III large subunit